MDKFHCIGIIAKPNGNLTEEVLRVVKLVADRCDKIVLGPNAAKAYAGQSPFPVLSISEMTDTIDLAVTIGGDGTMIGAARELSRKKIPIIGICAGRLGFITDIAIEAIEKTLPDMLSGHYVIDTRPMLEGVLIRDGKEIMRSLSTNDVSICHGRALGMVEYSIRVNDELMATQRADGILVSTATGSTAYAMSAGGPILHPITRSMLLVPVAPHTLTNRPVILHSSSLIKIEILDTRNAVVSFDAQVFEDVFVGDTIQIRVSPDSEFVMLHPKDYSHFDLLRRKLHWDYLPRSEHSIG